MMLYSVYYLISLLKEKLITSPSPLINIINMKKTFFLCSFAAIVAFVVGFMVCQNTTVKQQSNLIEAYNAYNKATEELLDTLDKQYDWVDAFDPQEYYDSRTKLDSLLWDKAN